MSRLLFLQFLEKDKFGILKTLKETNHYSNKMNIAIILASGMGKRMQTKTPKPLLLLQKKPLAYHTIKKFQESKCIDKILLVCQEANKSFFKQLTEDFGFTKVMDVIVGGKRRQDSSFNAVEHLTEKGRSFPEEMTTLLFHNVANPFVSQQEIQESIESAREFGASVVAHPTKDTVKTVSEKGMVEETLERKKLWNMQTPQTIQFELAKEVFVSAKEASFVGTDDVSLVERLGKPVKVVLASEFNFKLTTPMDLELAKIIIKKINCK